MVCVYWVCVCVSTYESLNPEKHQKTRAHRALARQEDIPCRLRMHRMHSSWFSMLLLPTRPSPRKGELYMRRQQGRENNVTLL